MKLRLLFAISVLSGIGACVAAPSDNLPEQPRPIQETDLAYVVGDWSGTLSYLDYSSGEEVVLPLELGISQAGPCLQIAFAYPNEPNANSTGERCLSADGLEFDGKSVSRSANSGIGTEFILEYEGEDNGQPAYKRESYRLSETSVIIETSFRRPEETKLTVRNTIDVKPAN